MSYQYISIYNKQQQVSPYTDMQNTASIRTSPVIVNYSSEHHNRQI